jgi:hypothetical protein
MYNVMRGSRIIAYAVSYREGKAICASQGRKCKLVFIGQ